MRHLSLASSFILLTLLGALGLATEVSALTYPVGVPTGEIAGGAYRTYFDNIFSSEVSCYNVGKVVGGFTSAGMPICVVPAPVGLNILGSTAGDTLRYNGTDWVRNNLLYNNGTNIGIGTTTPGAKLEIAGQIKITGGTPGLGKILTSDATGLASWVTPGSATNQVCPGTGTGNTCYGIGAGTSITTGNGNTANGYLALNSNTTGNINAAFGRYTLQDNTTGVANTAYGPLALNNNITGINNTADGVSALVFNITGNNNVGLGWGAGSNLTAGDNNIFLGYNTQPNISTTSSNQLNIGNWIYGNSGSIGIGVMNPGAKLDIAGKIKIADGTQGVGKVLTSDATGLATWSTAGTQVCPGTGTGNTCYGIGAGNSITTGNYNTVNGYNSLFSNTTGNYNTANGYQTLFSNTTGVHNIAYGAAALYSNTTGFRNVAVGTSALRMNISGNKNVAVGVLSLYDNTTGSGNTALGDFAGSGLTSGDNNIFLGYNTQPNISTTSSNQLNIGNWIYGNGGNIGIGVLNPGAKLDIAGKIKIADGTQGAGKVLTSDATGLATWGAMSASNQVCPGTGMGNTCYGIGAGSGLTTGFGNTVNGYQALFSNTIGAHNIANGSAALYSNTTGNYNIANGSAALRFNTTGNKNIALGDFAGSGLTSGDNNIFIGDSVQPNISTTASNQLNIGNWIYGNGGNIGIGVLNPTAKLEVAGQIKITGGTPGVGKVLTSDATGLATWTTGNQICPGTGTGNTCYGIGAGNSMTTGYQNTANGYQALFSNTTGYSNTANGYQALFSNNTGSWNTANGKWALYSNTTGTYNTANGMNTLYYNTTGYNNVANGHGALYKNTTGYSNTANGYQALFSNTTGYNNTANGVGALLSNTTGSSNTANGVSALISNTTGIQNTANGTNSLYFNTTGNSNTANGTYALYSNTTGYNNTANGVNSLYSNTTGYQNVANGQSALYFNTTGYQNVANGINALYSNTTGNANIANGTNALYSNTTGNNNIAIGQSALYANTTGNNNTAIGQSALQANITGNTNTAMGASALYANTTGFQNTANGMSALYSNTTGNNNTANGLYALYSNTTGYQNTAAGVNSLYANTTGYQNTAIGQSSLYANTTGYQNTAFGVQSLAMNTTGNNNTSYGINGLSSNTTGNNNLALGRNAGSNLVSGDNNIFIGFNVQPNIGTGASNQLNIGNWLYGNGGNIGIGVLNPGAKLEVAGQVKITGGTPGLGKILMSDATGLATWTNSISGATATGITGGSGNYIPKFGTGGTGLYSSVIYQNGTNIAIGTGTATAKLTLDSGVVNTAGLRLTRLTTTSPTYTGAVVGLGIDASGNVVPVSNGDVVVYDGIGRNGAAPTPNPNIANREISYDFNRYFLIPTKQSFVVSDGNGAGYNAPYFKEDGVSGLCSWNGASGTSPYDCATADPYTGLSASPNNSFTMTARGTSYGYQIALGARGDAPLFARSGKWYNATSNYGSGLYLADGTTPTPWQKVLTVPANHIEYFYVNIGYNSQLQAISGGGNIGMGTSTPDMRLVLAYSGSTGSTSEMMRIERGLKGADANMITTFGTPYLLIGGKETRTNSIQTIGFGYNSASSYQPAEIGLVTTNTAGNTQGDLVFATRGSTTNVAPTERMRIFGNGSVGIGTSTVASRFEVWSGATTLFHMRGSNNIGMGVGSVRSLLSGNANTGFGNESLYTLTTGYSNSAFGHQALRQSTTGYNNSAFGKEAMYNNGDGTWNTALGYQALRSGTSTDYNVAIGGQTLYTLGTGTGNVAIGHNALYGATTSTSNNIAIGYMAGSGITTGWNNIVIGNAAQARTSTGSNQLNIGNWIYGNGGNIGVGVSNPTTKLEVYGAIRAADNGYVGGTPFIYVGDDAYLSDVDLANTMSIQGVQNSAVGSIRLGSNAASYIYGNGGNIGVGTSTPGAKLDVNGTFKLGTAGTATTAAGTCTIASAAITTTATAYTCTGVPASTSVALSCSAAGAFTTPGTTGLYCRANGFANSITCNTTVANTNAMTYKCMWMQ